ncbi:MAG: hypothetical protein KKA54_15425 [Proteobacteria bacterium]|nr:hypothetical protein [Pseudomonadota bacterium]MBU0967762.1 hypothetical protein [Pseudomonadota bacterium]
MAENMGPNPEISLRIFIILFLYVAGTDFPSARVMGKTLFDCLVYMPHEDKNPLDSCTLHANFLIYRHKNSVPDLLANPALFQFDIFPE